MLALVVVVLLVVVGVALVVLGLLGLTERLPRNRVVGVRTPDAMSCQEAFALANKVAGLPTAAAGVLFVLAGVAVAGLDGADALVVALVGTLGAAGLVVAAGVQGSRVATALARSEAPVGPDARCADCTGCDLMASLRP